MSDIDELGERYRITVRRCLYFLEEARRSFLAYRDGTSAAECDRFGREFIRDHEAYLENAKVLDALGFATPEFKEAYCAAYTTCLGDPDFDIVRRNDEALRGVMSQHGLVELYPAKPLDDKPGEVNASAGASNLRQEVWHWRGDSSRCVWEGPFSTREEAMAAATKDWAAYELRGGPRVSVDKIVTLTSVETLLEDIELGVSGDLNICAHEFREALVALIKERFPIALPAIETCRSEDIDEEEDAAQ